MPRSLSCTTGWYLARWYLFLWTVFCGGGKDEVKYRKIRLEILVAFEFSRSSGRKDERVLTLSVAEKKPRMDLSVSSVSDFTYVTLWHSVLAFTEDFIL